MYLHRVNLVVWDLCVGLSFMLGALLAAQYSLGWWECGRIAVWQDGYMIEQIKLQSTLPRSQRGHQIHNMWPDGTISRHMWPDDKTILISLTQADCEEVRAAGVRGRGAAAGGADAAPHPEQRPLHDGRGRGDAGGLHLAGEGGRSIDKHKSVQFWF